ncbi:MAG TPA: HAMP domain-containing sensor histidine kinase [Terriglobales bacterium]|nr:HAMP domain-containing sensor histidine kinase [Terriglobales bacterium]
MQFFKSKKTNTLLLGLLLLYAAAALFVKKSIELAVFANFAQAFYQALAVFALLLNVPNSTKHKRAFWMGLGAGGALWFGGQCFWVYYEVFLQTEIPNPFIADIFFFLHTVPILAACSLQPHADFPDGDHRLRLGYFDFAILLVWWIFIYGYIVGPWQYVVPNEREFGSRYNFLYLAENLIVIAAFGVLWLRTQKSWRSIYRNLFFASAIYASSSFVINVSIDLKVYYTGGLNDIPLISSILLYAYVGFTAYRKRLEPEPALVSVQAQTFWHSRLAALAMISMPIFAAWAIIAPSQQDGIKSFRLVLTLAAMVLLMLLAFVKQNVLDKKMISLVRETRDAYENLQKLQTQLLQTEKLASMGRLVAGAAHEINNPLTAILGYSELLAEDSASDPPRREMAEKIRQQARRTKQLVQNLLTFAKQSPINMTTLDLGAIVNNALQLRELDLENKKILTVRKLPSAPVFIRGDENHLLQMCLHIFNNAVDAMTESRGGGTLTVTVESADSKAVLTCEDTGPGITEIGRIFDPFYTTKAVGKGTGLGLSACYGIVRDHGGEITTANSPTGGAVFVITLPLSNGDGPESPSQGASVHSSATV